MAHPKRRGGAREFDSIYRHGFVRVAVGTPQVRVASPEFNARETLKLARQARDEGAVLALFPELGISAYSNEDLFQQDALLDASMAALATLADATRDLPTLLVVGLPVRADDRMFNCALVLQRGRVLGAVPKSYLPNYREFYEKRHFAPAAQVTSSTVRIAGQDVPFGAGLLFAARNLEGFVLHAEICEDLWVPLPPSTLAALAGATVLANLSASDITVGKADYRRLICAAQSAKCVAAYLYSAAGPGESTTDLAWDGQALVYENGERLAESERFPLAGGLITADIDLDHLRQERARLTSFGDCVAQHSRAAARLPPHRARARVAEGPPAAQPPGRALPVRACGPGAPRRALRGGLQHPGRGPDEAPRGHGPEEGRDRRLRWPGFDPGGAGRGARLRPPGPAAQERAGLHAAGLRHDAPHL